MIDGLVRFKVVADPLPQQGPVKATERMHLLRARRPSLKGEPTKSARRKLRAKYGEAFWKKKLHRLNARKSLAYFMRELWHVLEPGTPLVWNWHLDVMCDALERVTRGDPAYRHLMINVPPGHTKSMLVNVFWIAWQWLENPGLRTIHITYVDALSNRDSMKCRDLITSDAYQDLIPRVWGDKWDRAWRMKDDQKNVTAYGTEYFGERRATSLKGAGTGFRANTIVIDDPMNVEEFPTPESLDAITSWFDKRISSRKNDMTHDAIVIIMQRLHENDLCGYVLGQDKAARERNDPHWQHFKHVCLPSEFDPDNANEFDKRTKRGELLFEGKFPRPVIEREKIRLGSMYSAQHDQRPSSAAGAIFPMCKLRFWIPPGYAPVPLPHKEKDENGNDVMCLQGVLPWQFDLQIQSWDMAFKDLDTSDFVCGGILGRKGADMYLIDAVHGHWGISASIAAVLVMSGNFPQAVTKIIEDKANGTAVIETLSNKLFGITAEEPFGSKQARAWSTEPYIKSGNVWLPHPALYPWVHDLLNEMRPFPRGKHDDWVDMLTQGIRNLANTGLNTLDAMIKL